MISAYADSSIDTLQCGHDLSAMETCVYKPSRTYHFGLDYPFIPAGSALSVRGTLYDPDDPMGKMFFNILATFAEFEADLIRIRTREGMAIARDKGKLCGKQPKLSDRQQRKLCRMHATGEYSISDLAELFSVSRPTVYRTLNRRLSP